MAKVTPKDAAKSGTEFGEQTAVFVWVALPETKARFPDARKLYAYNANAGKGDRIRGAQAKQAGVKSDVADLFLPVGKHGVHGLYIEMKIDPSHPANQRTGTKGKPIAPKRGELSDGQAEFRDQVRADGYGWALAEGHEQAIAIISQYLTE